MIHIYSYHITFDVIIYMSTKFLYEEFWGKIPESPRFPCIERKSETTPQPSQILEPVLLKTN